MTTAFRRTALAILVSVVALSCIRPPYPEYLLMQHFPTVVAIAALAIVTARFETSRHSMLLVSLFLILHTVGARYLYSFTPYDEWSQWLTGWRISSAFGLDRNHYDRVVHFSYGLLLTGPVAEFYDKHVCLRRQLSALLAIEFILASSAAYELVEWSVAIVFTPEWADQFLGQQGDVFDAQKDTGLAMLGSFVATAARYLLGFQSRKLSASQLSTRPSLGE